MSTKTCNKFANNEQQRSCVRYASQQSNCDIVTSACRKFVLGSATPALKRSNGAFGNMDTTTTTPGSHPSTPSILFGGADDGNGGADLVDVL